MVSIHHQSIGVPNFDLYPYNGDGSKPIITIFSGIHIHKPAKKKAVPSGAPGF